MSRLSDSTLKEIYDTLSAEQQVFVHLMVGMADSERRNYIALYETFTTEQKSLAHILVEETIRRKTGVV